MEPKTPTQSLTIVANLAVMAGSAVAYFWGPDLGDWVRELIVALELPVLALVNIFLRFKTTRPVALRG